MEAIPTETVCQIQNNTNLSDETDILKEFEPWVRRTVEDLPEARRAKMLGFVQELKLDNLCPETIERYVLAIRTLGNGKKAYEKLSREDLIDWLNQLKNMGPKNDGRYGYSESTLFLFKHHVKRFLRYCHNGNLETADKVGVLDCIRYRPPKQDFRKEILTEQEVRRLIDACETQRDRALIHTLYESGCRAGELLGLRIKDIQFDEYGCIALVKGKTGPRRIRLIDATPDLQLWVNMCPDRENQDAPLWPGRRKEGRSIGHKRLFRLLQNLAKQAGVRKHVHPHLFRHSRATHLASVLKEAQMREFFGWTKRSEVPSIYVHLSGRDVDRTLLEHRGIRFEEQVKEDGALRVAECPRCKFTNPAGAKFCNRCSMVLDKKEAQELDERLRLGEELQGLYTRFMSEHGQELNKQFFELPEAQRILLKLGYEKVGGG